MKNSLFIVCFFIVARVHAADSLLLTIQQPHTFFTTDAYNNIYAITPAHEIVRRQITGLNQVTFSNVRYGTPTSIDAGNPLKTMVYYADQQILVILDKMLAEIAVLKFSALNNETYRPTLVCRASGGDHFWLFDELSQRVIRLDEGGNRIAVSEPWYQLFSVQQTPVWMQSQGDQLYIYTTAGTLCVFDTFGTLGLQVDLPAQPLDMTGNAVLLRDVNGLRLFDLVSAQATPIESTCSADKLEIQPQYLFGGNGSQITICTR